MLTPFVFSDFAQLRFLEILIYARVLHRPSARGIRNGRAYRNPPPGGSASELAYRVAPRRRGATLLAPAVTTAGDGPTSRRTNFAISREGSRSSGAAASPRSARSGFLSTRRRGNFPACKALKTQEMQKLSPSSLRAKRENGLLPRGQARLRRILSGHGISRGGRENLPGCKALKTHETRKSSPSRLRNKVLPAPPSRRRLPRPIVALLNRGVSVARIAARENLTAERNRPEMAPQRLEKIESAPGNGMASDASKPQHLVHGADHALPPRSPSTPRSRPTSPTCS
jgi:hypothetical protein